MSGFHYVSTTLFVPNAKAPVSILRRALSRDQNPIPKFTIPYGRHLSFRQVRTPNRELTIFSRLSSKDAKKIPFPAILAQITEQQYVAWARTKDHKCQLHGSSKETLTQDGP